HPRPAQALKSCAKKGARLLKIHPAADGEGPDSPRYRAMLEVAESLNLPVIIHTGCMHSRVLYRDPEMGKAERFAPWFEAYPQTSFILAHMNFHEPETAIDLAEKYANVFVDTSWQPTEVIAEAVRRMGARKILFATDWPFIGNNLSIGVDRV